MKSFVTLFFLIIFALACPLLPNALTIYFNKKTIAVDFKRLEKLAQEEGLQVEYEDGKIPYLRFKKGDFAFTRKGKAIIIPAKKVKNILNKAFEKNILIMPKKDFDEILLNVAPAREIFYLPKGCKIDEATRCQLIFAKKYMCEVVENNGSLILQKSKVLFNHWYGVSNSNRVSFIKNCPKIKVLR